MLDGYPSHDIDESYVEAGKAQPLIETSKGLVRIGDVIAHLQKAGVRVFIFGGAARDWLRGIRAKDIDLSVDCSIQRCHAVLQEAYPDVDPILFKLEGFGILRWGRSVEESVDISIMRSSEDLQGKPLAQTNFRPSGSLRLDSQMKDFSINTFYYDCLGGKVLEPYEGSFEDLQGRRLRLISHPKKLAVDFRATLRIAQFFGRGYEPVPATWEYLERNADRDIQGMETMLAGWIGEHLRPEARKPFQDFVERYLRDPRSREVLSKALEEGSREQGWAPLEPRSDQARKA